MVVRVARVLLIAIMVTAVPSSAIAASGSNHLIAIQPGPIATPFSLGTVPDGWSSSAGQAVAAAERNPVMRALHRRTHPLQIEPFIWRAKSPYWYVLFAYHGKVVAEVNVSRAGEVTSVWTGPLALASYAHGGAPWEVNGWFVLLPASLLFLLTFLDPRRLRSITVVDGLAVLSFLVSSELVAHSDLVPAVWLAYPPLLYLLARLLKVGFGRPASAGRLAPLLSLRTLLVGLPLVLAARIVLSLIGHQEIDVGYESLIGASRILHHLPLYWQDPNHGDTYGPVTYLAYVPFQLLFPWRNVFSSPHAADVAAICFDLGTVVGLVLLGRRLRAGADGTRLGLVLAWAWATCPFTIVGLVVHTNDGLVSMLSVFALVALASPAVSGMLLGLAAAAKFSPAGLLPLLASPRQRGAKGALVCVGAFAAVVATALVLWLPPQGVGYFWQRTIGYQMNRADVFSPWALHPSLHPVQICLEALALLLVVAVAFVPRERSLARICALAGAVTIAVQLPATHWYYYYIMWFLPFALVGLLVRTAHAPSSEKPAVRPDEAVLEPDRREPALAGV
jgi:Glycosyltransferase family 87